ncbi:ribosomal protein L15 [Mytilinidion resinicola]|uniref:Ribosomal protein L15 n=1 Tax=Mytilinidion resinicola TaxID=574789 RepID=A0A6A6Z9H5_9PEZI|nr:ribosomal protein L15 [Mytilinidion resinicola]KAF2817666.1 ribosomal protein L15 [Mytilinidion resinicola]
MPPRLKLLQTGYCLVSCSVPSSSIAPILAPFLLPAQQRAASILSSLSDNAGAYSKRKRLGRGPASGKGKTSGRGQKGQKAHGKVPAGFNGGQTKIEVTQGPRGFLNHFSVDMSPLNLDRLQNWIDQGRLDPSKPITMKELNDSRCLHGVKDGVKLLARGAEHLKTPINLVVSRASTAAIAAIEGAGGTVTTRFYAPNSIKHVLKGLMDPVNSIQSSPVAAAVEEDEAAVAAPPRSAAYPYRLPDPTSRKDIEYYRDPAHRGYLSHLVGQGESPSLFFRVPAAAGARKKTVQKKKTSGAAENRIW